MDKAIIDSFCEQAAKVVGELLEYTQRAPAERDEANDGQIRRLRGVNGSIASALEATKVQFVPTAPAPASAPPPVVTQAAPPIRR